VAVKRIHTRVVIDIESGRTLKDEHFFLDGPIAEAKGGGGSSTSISSTGLPAWLQPYAQNFLQSYASQAFNVDPNTGQYIPKIPGQPTGQTALAGGNVGASTGQGGPRHAPQAAQAYLAANPDVAADPKYGASPQAAFQHYLDYGQNEGRQYAGPQAAYGTGTGSPLDQQIAQFTPDQLAAMGNIKSMTGSAQNLADIGAGQAAQTLSGAYLNPATNPYLNDTYNIAARSMSTQFANSVLPGVQAAAARAGQFGSSAMNQAMGGATQQYQQGLNDLATQIYGGAYGQERAIQQQAQAQLPTTLGAMYQPQYQLAGIGAQQQQQAQNVFDTMYGNRSAAFELPFNVLSGFGGALGQAGMGAGTSTTSTRTSGAGK